MKITQESTGEQTAVIKVEIELEDYQEKVSKSLKDLQHKANVPGFRPGHVPFGMINKMYGPNVKFEEINKILSESLDEYVKSNNLELVGLPLVNREKTKGMEKENQTNFEFFFDLGFAPKFELKVDKDIAVDYFDIVVGDKEANDYITGMRRRHGALIEVDLTEEEDAVKGTFVQLDENGAEKTDGIKSENSIMVSVINDEAIRNQFIGKKPGDKIVFNPAKAFEKPGDIAMFLNIKKEEAATLDSNVEFTIEKISRLQLAELNQEFFAKVFPNQNIETEEQMNELVKVGMQQSMTNESESSFMNAAMDAIIKAHNLTLPDDFTKRWLLENGEDKITPEQLEVQYPSYANSFRWRLIEDKILKQTNIEVTNDDIRNHVKSWFTSPNAETPSPEQEETLNKIVDSMLTNAEEVKRINDQLYDERLKTYFRENITVNHQQVSYADFLAKAYEHRH